MYKKKQRILLTNMHFLLLIENISVLNFKCYKNQAINNKISTISIQIFSALIFELNNSQVHSTSNHCLKHTHRAVYQ